MQSLAHLCCSFPIVAVQCRSLNNPKDGSVSLSGTTVGSTATYTCNDGFRLQGQSTRTCQTNGQWSRRAPTCQRKLDVANLCDHPVPSSTLYQYTAVTSLSLALQLLTVVTSPIPRMGGWISQGPFLDPLQHIPAMLDSS